jgi:hypothetical protein
MLQDGVARTRLVARLLQVVRNSALVTSYLPRAKALMDTSCNWPLRVEAPLLGGWAPHHEAASRYSNHNRTFRTFPKFSILLDLGEACARGGERKHRDGERQARSFQRERHPTPNQPRPRVSTRVNSRALTGGPPGVRRANNGGKTPARARASITRDAAENSARKLVSSPSTAMP